MAVHLNKNSLQRPHKSFRPLKKLTIDIVLFELDQGIISRWRYLSSESVSAVKNFSSPSPKRLPPGIALWSCKPFMGGCPPLLATWQEHRKQYVASVKSLVFTFLELDPSMVSIHFHLLYFLHIMGQGLHRSLNSWEVRQNWKRLFPFLKIRMKRDSFSSERLEKERDSPETPILPPTFIFASLRAVYEHDKQSVK